MSTKVIGENRAPRGDNAPAPRDAPARAARARRRTVLTSRSLHPAAGRCKEKAERKQRFFFKCCRNTTTVTTTPRRRAGSAHSSNEQKQGPERAPQGLRVLSPPPPSEQQPPDTQAMGWSGLLQAKYNLSIECFLRYRCTNWSWCLLQAQMYRIRPELFMDLPRGYGGVTRNRLWIADLGDNVCNWFEANKSEKLAKFWSWILVSWCLPLLQGLSRIRPLTRLFRSGPNKHVVVHKSDRSSKYLHCSKNNQIKALPLRIQREQQFLWVDGHSLFSSQSLT